jgi:hypothetical protein
MTGESTASESLHARVRRFGLAALGAGPVSSDDFERLALEIAAHQREWSVIHRRLFEQRGAALQSWHDIPPVPADAFRLGRVATHPASEDVACFQTSGTTGGSGRHAFRTLETYRELAVAWGAQRLLGHAPGGSRPGCATVLALAAPFEPERRSSLGYMMQEFMRAFDARALAGAGAFDVREPGRWLLGPGEISLEALERGAQLAARRGEPLLLLATSFALSWLLDALHGKRLGLPPGSVVMHTGGFKGHTRTLDDRTLALELCRALALPAAALIGEYGMTELGSQLYDSGFEEGAAAASVFVEPPWLRVSPVHPVTLRPVANGEVGLARFTDLCNIDSALVVLTQDLVRRVPGGIVLCGRRPGSRLRGCSLAVESLAELQAPGAHEGTR